MILFYKTNMRKKPMPPPRSVSRQGQACGSAEIAKWTKNNQFCIFIHSMRIWTERININIAWYFLCHHANCVCYKCSLETSFFELYIDLRWRLWRTPININYSWYSTTYKTHLWNITSIHEGFFCFLNIYQHCRRILSDIFVTKQTPKQRGGFKGVS